MRRVAGDPVRRIYELSPYIGRNPGADNDVARLPRALVGHTNIEKVLVVPLHPIGLRRITGIEHVVVKRANDDIGEIPKIPAGRRGWLGAAIARIVPDEHIG